MGRIEDFFGALGRHARRPAVDDGLNRWSYDDLLGAVDTWTRRLDRLAAQRVAYRLPNGSNWVALDLALLRSRRVAVPIPDFFTETQAQHILSQSGADTCVTPAADTTPAGFQLVDESQVDLVWRRTTAAAAPPIPAATAKITFTSGTTGAPKGACLAAEQMLATAGAIEVALGAKPAWQHLSTLPLSLLLENVAGVYANLGNGSRLYLPPLHSIGLSGSSQLDLQSFCAAQTAFEPNSTTLVPQLLLALTAAGEFGVSLPTSYRFIAVGGAKVSRSLLRRARATGLPVYEGYGLTECGSVLAVNLPGASRTGTVGRPLPHVSVRIVEGEIQAEGASMLGYLGEAPTRGTVPTGDLGHIDADGYLVVSGRCKSHFITAFGRNVSPEWIESELTSEVAIGHALVFGEALPGNVALLVARAGADAEAIGAAVAAANARLPDYAQVRAWQTIDADDFNRRGCLTDNGRPRRQAAARAFYPCLQRLAQALPGNPHLPDSSTEYSPTKEQPDAAIR